MLVYQRVVNSPKAHPLVSPFNRPSVVNRPYQVADRLQKQPLPPKFHREHMVAARHHSSLSLSEVGTIVGVLDNHQLVGGLSPTSHKRFSSLGKSSN